MVHDDDEASDTGLMLMLDANCINARQADPAINQLEDWSDKEFVDIIMCESSHRESYADGNAGRFKKASRYPYSLSYPETEEERWQLRDIEAAMFPDGATMPGQKNDVDIVFNAMKYTGILVTRDGASRRQPGGILGAASYLRKQHALLVMTPEEAVAYLRQRMRTQ